MCRVDGELESLKLSWKRRSDIHGHAVDDLIGNPNHRPFTTNIAGIAGDDHTPVSFGSSADNTIEQRQLGGRFQAAATDDFGPFHDVVVGMYNADANASQERFEMLTAITFHLASDFDPANRADRGIPLVHDLDDRCAMAFEIVYQDIGVEQN